MGRGRCHILETTYKTLGFLLNIVASGTYHDRSSGWDLCSILGDTVPGCLQNTGVMTAAQKGKRECECEKGLRGTDQVFKDPVLLGQGVRCPDLGVQHTHGGKSALLVTAGGWAGLGWAGVRLLGMPSLPACLLLTYFSSLKPTQIKTTSFVKLL